MSMDGMYSTQTLESAVGSVYGMRSIGVSQVCLTMGCTIYESGLSMGCTV